MASASNTVGLIDTDILIDAERANPDAVASLLSQQLSFGIHISTVSAMELFVGCRNAIELTAVRRFINRVMVLPVDATISQTALGLIESYSLSHGLLIPDAIIASSALAHGLTLFTKNTRHFQMIPNLTLVRPYQ